ncbi:MAG TPA: DUF2271 domain-containing protein [Limnobacter sp.]|uniref:DUF2271 domain-containing protein n=1 Tax=Limnobacter sp. TaxID=2003368 RepID=UPI002E377913|nr:DUF2271 domain-containing protein [Limnobacter sp.]HEX5484802.1 DUF2271 domain-containing protein [Limnobacter sp.]
MKLRYSLALGLPLATSQAMAADLSVQLELPQLKVAEYHKPYMAVWLERGDRTFVANMAVLYEVHKRNNGGKKWLDELRQWWRVSGNNLQMPIDGITGATRGPGEHTFHFSDSKVLEQLPAGQYRLKVEVARESGGREVLTVPFEWPVKKPESLTDKGREELGLVTVELKP